MALTSTVTSSRSLPLTCLLNKSPVRWGPKCGRINPALTKASAQLLGLSSRRLTSSFAAFFALLSLPFRVIDVCRSIREERLPRSTISIISPLQDRARRINSLVLASKTRTSLLLCCSANVLAKSGNGIACQFPPGISGQGYVSGSERGEICRSLPKMELSSLR